MSAYAELAVTTNFSFLRGASKAEELVIEAKAWGIAGIGIADRNSVAGVVRALTQNQGFCRGRARSPGQRGQERPSRRSSSPLPFSNWPLEQDWSLPMTHPTSWPIRATVRLGAGLRGCSPPASTAPRRAIAFSGCRIFWIILKASILLSCRRRASMPSGLARFSLKAEGCARGRSGLRPACSIAATTRRRLERLADIADSALVPLIAVNDVLYHAAERRALQDVVTCIREHLTLEEAGLHSKPMPNGI